MTRFPRSRRLACLASCLLVLAGCSSSSDSDDDSSSSTKARLRLANATLASSLTLNAVGVTDDDQKFSIAATGAGAVSGYSSTVSQTYTVGVAETSAALIASTESLWLSADTDYTLIGFERLGAVKTFALADNQLTPSTGFTSFAVANTAGDAGTLDVYLVAPDQTLNGISPAYASISANGTSTAKSITSGTYDVVVTASGKPSDRRLTLPSTTLTSGDMLTLALLPTRGGGLVDGAILHQGGGMEFQPSTTARVRVVGAFAAGATSNTVVRVTIGGTALPTLTAPSAGAYNLVAGNTTSYTVAIDGAAVTTLPVTTFRNGGDYTVLAYGTAAAPSIAVLQDANQPSSSGAANMRLVNAAVPGGLTLTTDYVPIVSDVEYGTASSYFPATASSAALLQITSPVASFPTYTASDVKIAGSGVYTVFVLGTTAAPLVVFAKDR